MKRKIITIDEDLCNGCGLCAQACHEGAIAMVDGKARLLRDDYCDGLGNCLPVCPTGAITFEEREADEYNQAAVDEHLKTKSTSVSCEGSSQEGHQESVASGCPGSRAFALKSAQPTARPAVTPAAQLQQTEGSTFGASELGQWPVQLKLMPLRAPYYQGAHLLIAADCAAFASGDFHNRFMKDKITVIGCPKLDEGSYTEKLTAILANNDIASVTIVRMEVPCCGGLSNAAIEALKNCGKMIPWQVVTLSVKGDVLS